MAENIGMELNLAVGKINPGLPSFIPPTFYTANSGCLITFIEVHHIFE